MKPFLGQAPTDSRQWNNHSQPAENTTASRRTDDHMDNSQLWERESKYSGEWRTAVGTRIKMQWTIDSNGRTTARETEIHGSDRARLCHTTFYGPKVLLQSMLE
ncbi:hypothetical protein J6590_068676 [Homalodisca vitripennis]|nr:hypothetical protein J6590_068676 [Homalodisca vitripennis]